MPKHEFAYMDFFTMRYVFSGISQKFYYTELSYRQNLDIREISIALA